MRILGNVEGWQEGLYSSVVFPCSVMIPKCHFPRPSRHLPSFFLFLYFFLFFLWDILWKILMSLDVEINPLHVAHPSNTCPAPLRRVEIQMTHCSMVCYRGCVLTLKPSAVGFKWGGIIYGTPCHVTLGMYVSKAWCPVPLGFVWVSLMDLFKSSVCGIYSPLRKPRRLYLP